MKQYILTIHSRNGSTKDETFHSEQELDDRIAELSKTANAGNEIESLTSRIEEPETEAKGIVLTVGIIASIISGEYHRILMIKTVLSKYELAKMITRMAVKCYNHHSKFPNWETGNHEVIVSNVIDWAKKEIFDTYNLKID
jgi:hypothetical protein